MVGSDLVVLTVLCAAAAVQPDDANSLRHRSSTVPTITDSDPERFGAIRKDLRGSVFCSPRTGPKGPPSAGVGSRGTRCRGTAGTSTVTDPLAGVRGYSEHRGAQSAASVVASSGRSRALFVYKRKGLERGYVGRSNLIA